MSTSCHATPPLRVERLTKRFRQGTTTIEALKDISLNIQQGQFVAVMGASGSGKSTLLHIMGSLDEPTVGKVYFRGKDVFAMTETERSRFRNRHIGFVFQSHHLLPEFSALENVMMPGLIAGRSAAALTSEAKDILGEVGLSHRISHRPSELSGGESQRVALARALLMKPDVILADEPTGNLDTENSKGILDLLQSLNRSMGVSLVVVTHDLDLAGKMGRTVEIVDGRIE